MNGREARGSYGREFVHRNGRFLTLAMTAWAMYTPFYVHWPHEPEDGADLLSLLRIRVLWHREASALIL